MQWYFIVRGGWGCVLGNDVGEKREREKVGLDVKKGTKKADRSG